MSNKVNIWLVIHLSASFLLLFTAFGSWQNIVSEAYTLNNYGNLGFYTLWAIYLSCAVFSFISTPIISKLGPRKSIQIGSFWYFVWVVSGLLPVVLESTSTIKIIIYVVMMLSGILIGFGASLIWVGQGKYITDCSVSENKGLYFGLFWWIYMNSQVIGNWISAFILDIFSQFVFFSIMSGFALLGFISFLFLSIPLNQNISTNPINESLTKSPEISSSNISDNQQSIATFESIKINKTSKINRTDQANINSTIKLFVTCQMMKVNALIIVGGIVLGVFSGFLVKMISNTIPSENEKLSKSLYCMMVFGFGEILAGYAIGKFIDYTNNRSGVVCSLISVILAFLSLIYTHSRDSYDVFLVLDCIFDRSLR